MLNSTIEYLVTVPKTTGVWIDGLANPCQEFSTQLEGQTALALNHPKAKIFGGFGGVDFLGKCKNLWKHSFEMDNEGDQHVRRFAPGKFYEAERTELVGSIKDFIRKAPGPALLSILELLLEAKAHKVGACKALSSLVTFSLPFLYASSL